MDEYLNERLNYYLDQLHDDEDLNIVLNSYASWLRPNRDPPKFEGF